MRSRPTILFSWPPPKRQWSFRGGPAIASCLLPIWVQAQSSVSTAHYSGISTGHVFPSYSSSVSMSFSSHAVSPSFSPPRIAPAPCTFPPIFSPPPPPPSPPCHDPILPGMSRPFVGDYRGVTWNSQALFRQWLVPKVLIGTTTSFLFL